MARSSRRPRSPSESRSATTATSSTVRRTTFSLSSTRSCGLRSSALSAEGVEPRAHDDRDSHPDGRLGKVAVDDEPEEGRPDERRVLEGRHDRRGSSLERGRNPELTPESEDSHRRGDDQERFGADPFARGLNDEKHPEEAHGHRDPASPIDVLPQKGNRERHHDERAPELDGDRVGERKHAHRGEEEEEGERARERSSDVRRWLPGANDFAASENGGEQEEDQDRENASNRENLKDRVVRHHPLADGVRGGEAGDPQNHGKNSAHPLVSHGRNRS